MRLRRVYGGPAFRANLRGAKWESGPVRCSPRRRNLKRSGEGGNFSPFRPV